MSTPKPGDEDYPQCGTCRFYDRLDDRDGICVRFPPSPSRTGVSGSHPVVGCDHWCGEWRPSKGMEDKRVLPDWMAP